MRTLKYNFRCGAGAVHVTPPATRRSASATSRNRKRGLPAAVADRPVEEMDFAQASGLRPCAPTAVPPSRSSRGQIRSSALRRKGFEKGRMAHHIRQQPNGHNPIRRLRASRLWPLTPRPMVDDRPKTASDPFATFRTSASGTLALHNLNRLMCTRDRRASPFPR